MQKLKYTFKTDTVFKMLFVQYPHLLRSFVAVLLGIPEESIQEFTIRNSEVPPKYVGGKFCRLDINMIVNGQLVDLEIQVENQGDYEDRTLLYWAQSFSSSLVSGQKYSELPRTLVISLVDFKLFDCEAYHSFFQVMETTRHSLLTDKLGLHFFELPKIPKTLDPADAQLMWLALFRADTAEDLETIRNLEVPVMNELLSAYETITSSTVFHEAQRLYERARHDEAQALYNTDRKARKEGRQEGRKEGRKEGIEIGAKQNSLEFIQRMFYAGLPLNQIAEISNLPLSQIEALRTDWAQL